MLLHGFALAISTLHGLIKDSEWYEFYDIVEIVGKEVRSAEETWRNSGYFEVDPDYEKRFGFQVYRHLVNELFDESRIGWRLGDDGLLRRELPEALGRRSEATQVELTDKFEPAREHYKKAVRYANSRPVDPENSIKEIVSAVESVGRVLCPNAITLGDVVKEMRKANVLPQHLVSVIEKFYAYACAEPTPIHSRLARI